MTLCLLQGVMSMLGASPFPAQEHSLGTHTQSCVCTAVYHIVPEGVPWCRVLVVAGLSVGCVSGSHLQVHVTLCSCWEIAYHVFCVTVSSCITLHTLFVGPPLLECIVWGCCQSKAMVHVLLCAMSLLGIGVHVTCAQSPRHLPPPRAPCPAVSSVMHQNRPECLTPE